MPKDKSPPEPETVAQQETGGGCQQEPCSPSSVSPETREEWRRLQRLPDGSYSSQVTYGDLAHGMSAFAKKMEIERDEARQATRQWIEAWDRYGDGASLMHPRLTMAITAARKSLPENVELCQPCPPSTPPRQETADGQGLA